MKKEYTVNLNGTYYSAGKLISSTNRAFLYGDSIFESIRFYQDVLHWELHYARLLKAAAAMGFIFSPWWTEDYFRYEIRSTIRQNGLHNARIRLILFRDEEAESYQPKSDRCSYLIQVREATDQPYQNPDKGLNCGLFEEVVKARSPYSHFKTGQSLLFVLASRKARNEGWDEALLLNDRNRLCESSKGNIWLVIDNVVWTPSVDESCVNGVMREYLFKLLPKLKFEVREGELPIEELDRASELWISNASNGIQWAERCGKRTFDSAKGRMIANYLQNEFKKDD